MSGRQAGGTAEDAPPPGPSTLDAPKSAGRLERVLRAGGFALTAETAPPDSADPARRPACW